MSHGCQEQEKLLNDMKLAKVLTHILALLLSIMLSTYFEALDLVISAIKGRFDQAGYKMYINLQEILLKASNGYDYSNELQTVTDF